MKSLGQKSLEINVLHSAIEEESEEEIQLLKEKYECILGSGEI